MYKNILISSFPVAHQKVNGVDMTIEMFQQKIIDGTWSDHFLDMKNLQGNPEAQEKYKKTQLPYVTPSGTFSERKNAGLLVHSGILALDFDNVDPAPTKKLFHNDKYVFFAFTSISGTGVCAFIYIDGKRHAEAFEGAAAYFYSKFGLIADSHCKDISRARFVSYDQQAYQNPFAEKFLEYHKKDKLLTPKRIPNVVHVEDDFNMVMKEIGERRVDITGNYASWFRIGLAIADKFGETGLDHFHAISEHSLLYTPDKCTRQFKNCLRSNGSGINIATFYYYAKLAGLAITSTRTQAISQIAASARNAHSDQKAAMKRATEDGFEGPDVANIVAQVFDNNIEVPEVSEIESIEFWIKENHELRKNEITGKVENRGTALIDYEVNSIEIDIKKLFPKIDYGTLSRIMNSKMVPMYHPLKEFFTRYADRNPIGVIAEYFSCITSTNPPEYVLKFGKKWLVGLIANIFEEFAMSPLMLVLCGKPGTGKSYFFEKLLPTELLSYYAMKSLASTKHESGKKDLEILFSNKVLILDDEMAGKTKRDIEAIKNILSASGSNVRAAFGKNEERRKRIATFSGTCNDLDILNDPTGDRRFIPIEVLSIDWDKIDKVDRISLIMEAYNEYRAGFDYRVLGDAIGELNQGNERFHVVTAEEELIESNFSKSDDPFDARAEYMTATEIQIFLQQKHIGIRLDLSKITAALRKIGIVRQEKRVNGKVGRWYHVVNLNTGVTVPAQLRAIPF